MKIRKIGTLLVLLSMAGCAGVPEAQLDPAALMARLRDTHALGALTRVALENQVDDLVDQFRARRQSGQNADVASLRQPYDMLVFKVLAVVQDSDPPLARAIAGSWEGIWGILAGPEAFRSGNPTRGEAS